ncbi:DUF5799 family protein [Halorarius halobius]|uniref:DUF5799 family protein n=1 Tax=Halorarius halobius TaxID=2962671 RepID=UPI0020CBDAF2|nr:DUF5799 family protein [Halorarius halobius]
MTNWQDRIVGARMAVDDEYSSAIDNSGFSRQEWGMVMTAVEFDIRNADDDEHAELYADTSNLKDIMPEVESVAEMQSMGMGQQADSGGGGVLDSVKSALGLGGDGSDDADLERRVREAEDLVDGYATELQAHLEANGTWEEVLAAYREQDESA